jgi:hypothetical protein
MKLLDRIDKLIPESVFGKQKSKSWFKYRGLVAGAKVKDELSKLMKKMEKATRTKELTKDELQDLINKVHVKYGRVT